MQIDHVKSRQLMIVIALDGSKEMRRRLTDLGFTPGTPVCVISRTCKSIIVKLKGKYIMLSKQMAYTVKVEQGREKRGLS